MGPMSEIKTAEKPAAGTTSVILINNQARLELIQQPGSDKMLQITTGLNLMKPEDLRALRENPAFDVKFTTKIVASRAKEAEFLKVGLFMLEQGKEVPANAPFSKLADQEARELVDRINDEDLLEELLRREGRSEIRAAMEERKKFLKTGSITEAA